MEEFEGLKLLEWLGAVAYSSQLVDPCVDAYVPKLALQSPSSIHGD